MVFNMEINSRGQYSIFAVTDLFFLRRDNIEKRYRNRPVRKYKTY